MLEDKTLFDVIAVLQELQTAIKRKCATDADQSVLLNKRETKIHASAFICFVETTRACMERLPLNFKVCYVLTLYVLYISILCLDFQDLCRQISLVVPEHPALIRAKLPVYKELSSEDKVRQIERFVNIIGDIGITSTIAGLFLNANLS